MDYQNKEEFYGLMRKKRVEIDSLDIPKEVKKRLYSVVEETIQRYEDNARTKEESMGLIAELEKAQIERARIDEQIGKSAKEAIRNLAGVQRGLVALTILEAGRRQKPENN